MTVNRANLDKNGQPTWAGNGWMFDSPVGSQLAFLAFHPVFFLPSKQVEKCPGEKKTREVEVNK